MDTIKNKTVADLVTDNIKTADVFKKYGIDFCCGGGISVEKACAKEKIDFNTLAKELLAIDSKILITQNYKTWALDYLADYIVNTHHTYVTEAIPLLIQYSDRVAKVHGHHYTEVIAINKLVHTIAEELTAHMKKEELILFPFIKRMIAEQNGATYVSIPPFENVEDPIKMMEEEHEVAGDILKEISVLSNNHTPPEGACNTFKALYNKLQEFEDDLHQHVHLENNILFPKAIQLEKELSKTT
ncbi:iron-sulfur cluster repair di-iron protein [Cellulophaga sp. F20128]|uniref:iron-sulfur cluster repair di-iron protein n=1 Tax=Cellulophaga sp. F20128 TaxID=2926413 RepID=UPI001FF6DF51|nr:iron-sulfur cluster repair di-iron protein [Cellulophaga sp. F20128]MCK0156117.1 iron-sulfur cluster repair di-iron protein [Cellulophaga sp. F20128]